MKEINYGSRVNFRIRKMTIMKETRRTIPTSSLIMEQTLHCRGMVASTYNLLWRSLERTFDIPRRAGESVYFISGLSLGILLIMIVSYDV